MAKQKHAATGTPMVLVVEDEVLVRMLAVAFLEDQGFRVLEAGNADDALTLLRARADVRVLFTHVDMPGSMDGLALARHAAHEWPDVAVLVASGKAWPRAGELPQGARFLPKPRGSCPSRTGARTCSTTSERSQAWRDKGQGCLSSSVEIGY